MEIECTVCNATPDAITNDVTICATCGVHACHDCESWVFNIYHALEHDLDIWGVPVCDGCADNM